MQREVIVLRIPHDANVANVSFEFNITGPFSQATAQCRIKDRRQRDRSHLFEQNFINSGTFDILDFDREKNIRSLLFITHLVREVPLKK